MEITNWEDLFSMAVVFSGDAIVNLRHDFKEIQDVVVGDELLALNGKYRRVTAVYRPHYYKYPFLRYGIGAGEYYTNGIRTYLEVGEHTQIMCRKGPPFYDITAAPKSVSNLTLSKDMVEICNTVKSKYQYFTGDLMKISLKRCDRKIPYLIGIDEGYLVVNKLILAGCDADRIQKLKRKEESYVTQEKVKSTRNETGELREDNEVRETPEYQD